MPVNHEPVSVSTKARGNTNFKGRKVTGFKIDGVEIEGLDELIEDFLSLGEDMIYKLGPATVECADIIAKTASIKVNKVSGDLARGIVVKQGRRSKNSKKAYQIFSRVELTKGAMHGIPLELGHRMWLFGRKTLRHVEQKPFLRPAADESKNAVATIMIDAMNEAIDDRRGSR